MAYQEQPALVDRFFNACPKCQAIYCIQRIPSIVKENVEYDAVCLECNATFSLIELRQYCRKIEGIRKRRLDFKVFKF